MTDKPAATVHGTGSGEAQDELCPRCHDKKLLHKSGGCMAMDCSCSLTFIPASPTVTQLARVAELLEELNFCSIPRSREAEMSDHTEEIRARVESYRDVTEVNRVQSLRANFCDKHREICECSTGPCVMCGAAALRQENERLKGALEQLDAAAGEVITMEEARYVGTPLTVEPWIDRLADAIHIARRAALASSPAPARESDHAGL